MSSGQMPETELLIAPKSFLAFGPEEFHTYVRAMYSVRVKGRAKPASPAEGLTLLRKKDGTLSLRMSKTKRSFEYVLVSEVEALASGLGVSQAEVWNAFKARKFIIAKTRMEAERMHAALKGIPF